VISSRQHLSVQPYNEPDPQLEHRIDKLSHAVKVIPPVSAELSATKAAVDHLALYLSLASGEERGWRDQQHESLMALRHQMGDLERELQAVTQSVDEATADATRAEQAGARQVAALQLAQSELADAVAALEDKLRCARARDARWFGGPVMCCSKVAALAKHRRHLLACYRCTKHLFLTIFDGARLCAHRHLAARSEDQSRYLSRVAEFLYEKQAVPFRYRSGAAFFSPTCVAARGKSEQLTRGVLFGGDEVSQE
jgi:hypothetical protein